MFDMEAVKLSGIARTLLMPLCGRAKATRGGSRILVDATAVQIVDRLALDLGEYDRILHPSHELFASARARALDDLVRAFLQDHPRATVINLGAGLDTGFSRIDNGYVRWIDVDVAEVIDIRRRLIPETDRSRCVAASLLETLWMKEIGPCPDGLFFLACGVLVYFREEELRRLLSALIEAFRGAELAFDLQSRLTNFFGNRRLNAAGMGTARFRWGGKGARPVERLGLPMSVIESFGTFSRLPDGDFADPDERRLARLTDRLGAMTILHVRFNDTGP